jgi:basic membrane protein A
MGQFAGDSVLVSAMWEFGPFYTDRIEAGLNGTWSSQTYWGGLKDGIVRLSDFSPLVPDDVRELVLSEKAKIESGSWDVFNGPVMDQSGQTVIAAGEVPSDGDLLGMGYFVKGVEGTVNQ